MSDEPFLIAHKVRGLPAFDIAIHMTCPVCEATNDHCHACDGVGHWWIIPTSGHRAYPYWSVELMKLAIGAGAAHIIDDWAPTMPTGLRDHYTTERETVINLTTTLGLTPKPLPPILRRL